MNKLTFGFLKQEKTDTNKYSFYGTNHKILQADIIVALFSLSEALLYAKENDLILVDEVKFLMDKPSVHGPVFGQKCTVIIPTTGGFMEPPNWDVTINLPPIESVHIPICCEKEALLSTSNYHMCELCCKTFHFNKKCDCQKCSLSPPSEYQKSLAKLNSYLRNKRVRRI